MFRRGPPKGQGYGSRLSHLAIKPTTEKESAGIKTTEKSARSELYRGTAQEWLHSRWLPSLLNYS